MPDEHHEVEREDSPMPHAFPTGQHAEVADSEDPLAQLRKVHEDEDYSVEVLSALVDLPSEDVQRLLAGDPVSEEAVDHVVRWLGPGRP